MAGTGAEGEIAVTVIGGYLGAGKTTLVNHVLRTAEERIAVLVNDFGDVNIDAELIESDDGDTISLANGCICCSLVDGFAAALATVRELDPPPARLVIEASGVADPATVAAYGHGPGLALDAVVVVVDAETVRARAADKYVGDTVVAQLRSADIVLCNKVDLVGPDVTAEVRAWLAGRAPEALLVETTEARVDPEVLFGRDPDGAGSEAGAGDGDAGHDGHRHDPAEAVYDSWTWSADRPVDRAEIESAMAALPDSVVRAKGLLAVTDRPDRSMVLQRVGRRWTLRAGPSRDGDASSRLVLIGLRGAIDDAWLAEHLPT